MTPGALRRPDVFALRSFQIKSRSGCSCTGSPYPASARNRHARAQSTQDHNENPGCEMKRVLACLSVGLAATAGAEPAMVADDGEQGQVVLTAETLDGCGAQRLAYLTRPLDPDEPADTITFWGCWTMARNEVRVKYFVGNEARYERTAFTYEEVDRLRIPQPAPPDDDAADAAGPSA